MYKNKINFLLNEIIRQRPDLSEDRVISLAQRKKEEIKGISDYTALLLVAIDLGVKLSVKQSFITPIGKLVDSLNSVNVKGRILWVGQEKKFKRRDGTTGMFVRAGIGDSTGVCSVIFWDRPRRELEELGVVEGNVVEISYASTRKSLSGEVELHVGLKSEIMDRSDEIDQYPPTADFLKPLSEIMSASGRIYTLGQVINEPVKTKFKIEGEDEERSLLWFNITDGKKVVRVVVWNPNQNYEWVKPGTTVAIFNAKPKIGLNGEIELHVGKVSHISPFSGKEYEIKFKPSILKDLKQGYNMAKIYVRINAIGKLKIFEAKRKSISIHASDISSDVNITFIGKIAEKIVGLKPGDVISIAGFRVRLRRGEIFIFCDDFTELDINPEIMRVLSFTREMILLPEHFFPFRICLVENMKQY